MFELSLLALIVSIVALAAYIAFNVRTGVGFFLLFYCSLLFIFPAVGKLEDLATYIGTVLPKNTYEHVNWYITAFFISALLGVKLTRGFLEHTEISLFDKIDIWKIRTGWFFFLGVSYLSNVMIYNTMGYFFGGLDVTRFNAMMSLANGSWFLVILAGVANVPTVLYVGHILKNRNMSSVSILKIIIVVAITIIITFPATRTGLLAYFVAYGIILYDRAPTFGARFRMAAIALPLALATLLVSQILNMQRQGLEIENSIDVLFSSNSLLSSKSTDFFQYDNAAYLVDRLGSLEETNFGFLAATISPINLVPTGLLPFAKPRADKDAFLTESIFGSSLDQRFYTLGSTITFSMPVTSTTDFGLLGVVISGIGFGFLLGLTTSFAKSRSKQTVFFMIYYSVIMISAIRFSFEGLILQFQIIAIVVLLMRHMPAIGRPKQTPSGGARRAGSNFNRGV